MISTVLTYDPNLDAHGLGACLVGARGKSNFDYRLPTSYLYFIPYELFNFDNLLFRFSFSRIGPYYRFTCLSPSSRGCKITWILHSRRILLIHETQ